VRVVTYNIKSGLGGIQAVAGQIRALAPDVACLQEVRKDQERELAAALGMVPAKISLVARYEYGNALLLPEDPAWVREIRFEAGRDREPRGCIVAGIDGVAVGSVHLGLDARQRVAQAIELIDALAELPDVVIGGDLNEVPGGAVLSAMLARFSDSFGDAGSGEGSTFPSHRPNRRIDYVMTAGRPRAVACRAVDTPVSDHLPVVADLRF
jgi:endonuclease/exonuclease/phosphatase family metal-dependent hydrolase